MTDTSVPTAVIDDETRRNYENYAAMKHNVSWALIFICPAIIAAPPRKLDFYTFMLGSAWLMSANQITREKTGQSLPRYFLTPSWAYKKAGEEAEGAGLGGHPTERARQVHEQLKRERERRANDMKELEELKKKQAVREREETDGKEKGVLEKIWMGDETEGWKERRLHEEQKALEDGKGYGDLIWEQIMEVWAQRPGAKKERDAKAKKEDES